MKILVTGANGFIGSALIKYLNNFPNFLVIGMVRSIKDTSLSNSIEFRLGEIGSDDKSIVNMSDIDVVIHTAGRAHIMNDNSTNPIEEFRSINTYGTIDLARSAEMSGVKRFIFLSSIKVNGESTNINAPFSIDSIENPQDAYSISKYEAEIGLRKMARETELEVTIIRLPLVYGLGVKGNFSTLIKLLSLGIPLPFALVSNNRRSMVGIDNLTNMIAVCVWHPKAANQTFLISDKDDLSTFHLLRLLGSSIDKPAVLFKFPVAILNLLAKLFFLKAKAERIMGTLQVNISHTCNHLDWEPPFSVEQGMKKLKKKKK